MYLGDENYLGATAYLGEGGESDTPTVTPGYLGIVVGGVTFTSEPWAQWVVQLDGFKGWFDGAPVRSDAPQRPGQHGQFALPAYRDGRSVGMTVWCRTNTPAEVGQAQRAITGILADGGYGVLTVVEPDGMTTSAVVRLADQPLVETYAWRTVSAQLELWSPDPYRYGPRQQKYTTLPESVGGLEFDLFTDGDTDTGALEFGEQGSLGRVTLTNEGNAPAWPTFEVRGPASQGFTVRHVESGRRIVSTTYIPAGSSLTVNTANGMATLDGVDRSGQLTVREWSPVPAGGTATYAFTAPESSPASLVASVYPTYW